MGMLINIDNGGTLTDFCAYDGERLLFTKTLTTPHDLSSCFFDGLHKLSALTYGEGDVRRLLQETATIRYSTTQGTNALVQRTGPRIGLVVSATDAPVTLRNDEHRAGLYDALAGERVRVVPADLADDALDAALTRAISGLGAEGANRIVISLDSFDPAADEQRYQRIVARRYPSHLLGALPVTFGAEGNRDPDYARRTWTALLNAFLHPAMERFLYSAERRLKQHRTRNRLLIFRNDGGAARVAKTMALKTYSSGPRGGLEGARELAAHYDIGRLISIDVGGTTTDIVDIVDARVDEDLYGRVDGVPVSIPLSRINSAGVGGSSVIRVADGELTVGPDSVGAAPGPACFGRGGDVFTLTDAALLNGMIDPSTYFGGELPLDRERAAAVLAATIAEPLGLATEAALLAAEAAWVEAIRRAVDASANGISNAILSGIGGGGPMLLTALADALNVRQALIPAMAPVFSAYGIGFSDLSQHYQEYLAATASGVLAARCNELQARAARDLFAEGIELNDCRLTWRVVDAAGGQEIAQWAGQGNAPELVAAGVVLRLVASKPIGRLQLAHDAEVSTHAAQTTLTREILTPGGACAVPLFRCQDLAVGATFAGGSVCIVEDEYFTARIDAGWRFCVTGNRDLRLERTDEE